MFKMLEGGRMVDEQNRNHWRQGSYDSTAGRYVGEALVVLAAAPFVQAVATHFGNRLAGAVDESTRSAVRRFLRRQVEEQRGGASTGARRLLLRPENGWGKIIVPLDLPPEGLAQLFDLCDEGPPDGIGFCRVSWVRDGWICVPRVNPEGALYQWDGQAKDWIAG
ncbi:hypothetical protein V2J94_36345 [Streptomyces sp. DSM 41524]|uniref:Uncharacterized protein n=2 Tax=Streptomyces asiaticus TaxID=114695 RepID=A0ABU7Q7C0_9ACTN|nr:hypothetical protein [Streptomyces sp. DSM 41524]